MRERSTRSPALAFRRSLLLVSVVVLLAQESRASCGLDGCPVLLGRSDPQRRAFLIQGMIRQVGFDIDSNSGDYTQLLARFEFTGWERWGLGAYASFVSLRAVPDDSFGLTNPVLYVEYRPFSSSDRSVSLGFQLEVPLPGGDERIASDHLEAMPYVGARQAFGNYYATGHAALRTALGHAHEEEESGGHEHTHKRGPAGDHGHGGHGELLVNPHEDHELLYRFGFGRIFGKRPLTPEVFLDAQHVLGGDLSGTAFLSVGLMVKLPVGKRHQLHPLFAVPLSEQRRFDWATGIGFTATL